MAYTKVSDTYILDTYRSGEAFHPAAIAYCGRRRMETLRWPAIFATQDEADAYVRSQLSASGMAEARNEGELREAA